MKKNQSLLTVIMSVRNNESTLKSAIDSLLEQTYQDFKILIVDDASTDTTPSILERYRNKHKNIEIITNRTSKGLAENLNMMLGLADTEFVARMDGDDVCYPDRFAKQIDYLKKHPEIDILGTAAHIIGEKGQKKGVLKWPTNDKDIKKAIWCNPIIHPSVIYKRQKILDLGGYPPYPRRQDYALWFKAMKAEYKFHNLPHHLIQYRVIEKHYKKDPLKQLIRQTKIGWCGYASVGGINPAHYCIMAWPVIRSILPVKLQTKLQKYLRRYDPRRNHARKKTK